MVCIATLTERQVGQPIQICKRAALRLSPCGRESLTTLPRVILVFA
jgi:hypothetical protein